MEVESPFSDELVNRLEKRELNGKGYFASTVLAQKIDGSATIAMAFLADISHEDFWQGNLSKATRLVRNAKGDCGTNIDYVESLLSFELTTFGSCTKEIQHIKNRLSFIT